MIDVRLPRLLDKNLNEVKRLHPKSQSAEINLTPLTTASLTLDEGSGVKVRDFIELFNSRGSAGIFRVKSPSNGYGTYTDTISLEHGIAVLGDAIIPGEGTKSGTPLEVLSFIMGYQTAKIGGVNMWKLGTVEATESVAYDYRDTTTLHALLDVVEMLDGYMLSFNQSSFPWTVHVLRMEDTPSCEGRIGRNVVSARVTIDDSELCTRVYASRLDGGYMQLEENPEWGIVEKSLDFGDEVPIETVKAECRRYLEARKAPAIAVEIDGFELAAETGETLDSFNVGRMMRLALPMYGIEVDERITSISYASMIDQPETVRVYLANKLRDASTDIAGLQSSVSSLGSTSVRYGNRISSSENNITNLKDADEGIKQVNDKFIKWFSSVEIDLDATEEGARFGALASYEELQGFGEEFDKRISEAELVLWGGPGSAVAGLVARVDDNAAAIIATANDLGTQISLKADRIDLQGYVTASELNAEIASINKLFTGNATAAKMVITNLTALAFTFDGNAVKWTSKEVVTGVGGSLKMGNPFNVVINADTGATRAISLAYDVSVTASKEYIYYLTW